MFRGRPDNLVQPVRLDSREPPDQELPVFKGQQAQRVLRGRLGHLEDLPDLRDSRV